MASASAGRRPDASLIEPSPRTATTHKGQQQAPRTGAVALARPPDPATRAVSIPFAGSPAICEWTVTATSAAKAHPVIAHELGGSESRAQLEARAIWRSRTSGNQYRYLVHKASSHACIRHRRSLAAMRRSISTKRGGLEPSPRMMSMRRLMSAPQDATGSRVGWATPAMTASAHHAAGWAGQIGDQFSCARRQIG